MNREKAEEALRLIRIATAEVSPSDPARLRNVGSGFTVSRPFDCAMPRDMRWRSVQLARLHRQAPTECFPCWNRRLEIERTGSREEALAVQDQCCGMFGCPGPLVDNP